MATVKDILAVKGRHVHTVGEHVTVLDAVDRMNERRVGCLIVAEEGSVRGIVSERDIVHRVVGERRDPETTTVGVIMSADVLCCRPHTDLEEARVVMKERRVRHLPVLDARDELCGLISIGDLNAHDAHGKELTIHLLEAYIAGQPVPS